HGRALDGENVAVAREGFGIVAGEDLDFDGLGERLTADGQRAAPNEEAGVAVGLDVLPLKFGDEIFVLAQGAQNASGHAGGDDNAVAHGPGAGGAVYVGPAGEIAAVKEWLPILRREQGETYQQKTA